MVGDRRTGKNAFYRLDAPDGVMDLLRQAAREVPEAVQDRASGASTCPAGPGKALPKHS